MFIVLKQNTLKKRLILQQAWTNQRLLEGGLREETLVGWTDGRVHSWIDGVITGIPLRKDSWTDGRVQTRTDGGVAGLNEICY